jgi:putative sterol carrier protein
MARFLSAEWLEQLAAAAATDEMRRVAAGTTVAVRQVVTGAPEGDVDYVVRVDRGKVAVGAGGPADVEITGDYATAVAISQGLITPAAAFAGGRLKLGGRVGLLVEHAPVFAALGGVFAASPTGTTY